MTTSWKEGSSWRRPRLKQSRLELEQEAHFFVIGCTCTCRGSTPIVDAHCLTDALKAETPARRDRARR
jgi:hypothetical protein